MHKKMSIESVVTMIAEDLEKIQTIIKLDKKYPEVSVEEIMERIRNNYHVLQNARRSIISVGDWVQLHVGGSEPVYAKVTGIHPTDDSYILLSGMFNQSDHTPNAYLKENALPVSLEIGRLLEFANGNNKGKS